MRGRLLHGREVHILDAWDGRRGIGRLLCRLHEGKVRMTDEQPTCRACIRRYEILQWMVTP